MGYYMKNIAFTTTSAEQDLLQLDVIKSAIKERMAIDDSEYSDIVSTMGFTMSFNVFCEATRVKINNGTYNELLEDVIYSSGGECSGIKSIKIEDTNITGTFSFKMS